MDDFAGLESISAWLLYPTIHPASVQGVKSASSLFTLRELTSWFGAESQAVQGTTLFRGLY
jgi:hypothetical protein